MNERVMRSSAERIRGYRAVLEARNPEAAPDRLRVLAADDIRPVRVWTARNHLTPPDVLARLAQDPDSAVRWNALLNANCPDSALRAMADSEAREVRERGSSPWFIVRNIIVHHPSASESLKSDLLAAGACNCPGWCGRGMWVGRPRA